MSFLKHKVAVASAVLSAVMAVSLLGSSFTYAFGENYKSWKQYGSSWSSMYLGNSSDTMQQSGCVVTSAAILMVHSGSVSSVDFNPSTLLTYLNQNGGFNSYGELYWSALSGYTSDFQYIDRQDNYFHGTSQAQKTQEIKELLDQGYYVMLQLTTKNGLHFVAVDSVDGAKVTIMDPGKAATSLFDAYTADQLVKFRLFRGKNSSAESAPETAGPQQSTPTVDAPETAPVPPETLPPETTTTTPEPETTTSTTTTVAETTTIETTTTTTEATTTTTETTTSTTPEITTTNAETTDPIIHTRPETLASDEEFTSETVTEVVPVETELAETFPGTVEFVILEDAPETAPASIGQNLPTSGKPKTRSLYVPEEQAEATLIELKNQHVFMSIRFIISADLNLHQNADADSDILTVIPAGTSLSVVEVNEEFTWGRVAFEGVEGWITLNFAEL